MEKQEIKYTIITPVYNSFELMKNYFESLEKQEFKNFEVIIIDDCSTDESYENLLNYTKKSELIIKILKTEYNSGPGKARNLGIANAKGEWITFIDNDDWIANDFFIQINKIIMKENIDCLVYDYYKKFKNGKEIYSKSFYGEKQGYIKTNDAIKNITNHTVGKVYKLDKLLINNIVFPNLKRCEDVTFTTLAVSVCKNIYYLENPLYYYYQHGKSLSNSSKLDEYDMVQAFSILQNRLESKYPDEIKEKSIRDLLYGAVLMMCKAKKSNEEIKKYIETYEKKYQKWYLCDMVHKIGKLKYLYLICIKYRILIGLKFFSYLHSVLISK